MAEARGPDQARLLRAAARRLALQRGIGALDADQISAAAALSPGSLQHHYEDVEGCLLAAYREDSEQMIAALGAAVDAEPSWLAGMRALGQAMIAYLRADPERARFLVVEVAAGGDRIRLAREQDLAEICELIDRGRLESADPDAIGPETAIAVAGAIFLQVYQGLQAGRLDQADEMLPEMMYTLVLPYLGEEAARAELARPAAPPSPG